MEQCKHEVLEPKQHPDGPVVPACIECGKFVVRGELNIVMPLGDPSGTHPQNH